MNAQDNSWIDIYEKRIFHEMPYRLLRPIDLADHPDKSYPLIFSLHGAAGKGTDNVKNLRRWNEIFTREDHRRKYPCFVLAPQTPLRWLMPNSMPEITTDYVASLSGIWQARVKRLLDRGDDLSVGDLGNAFDLLDAVCDEFHIDRDRVYVLGHSMGGFGTWNAICEQPERFAAAIPSAGGCELWNDIAGIVDVPIWTFHGDADPTVPVDLTQDVFRKLDALNANTKYTELKDVKHNASAFGFAYTGDDAARGFVTHYASDRCDKTANVWDWLFAQKRGQ
ncbi:MAG: prolyl oligopeptidase family serine peptidase [Candidatus Latescibacteria bacterium]|jgi:predicted peptidase|nr:prolyl oligopeptidase family serine peptidase [Candidatus Latescibacterota bacterium]